MKKGSSARATSVFVLRLHMTPISREPYHVSFTVSDGPGFRRIYYNPFAWFPLVFLCFPHASCLPILLRSAVLLPFCSHRLVRTWWTDLTPLGSQPSLTAHRTSSDGGIETNECGEATEVKRRTIVGKRQEVRVNNRIREVREFRCPHLL